MVFPVAVPANPFVKLKVPILLNLSVPPSAAVTVICCGDTELLPLEFAKIV